MEEPPDEGYTITNERLAAEACVHKNTLNKWVRDGLFFDIRSRKTSHHRSGVKRFWELAAVERVQQIVAFKALRLGNADIIERIKKGAARAPTSDKRGE